MAATATFPQLTSGGHALDPDHVGVLRDSSSIASDAPALRQRMNEDGYLYLPGQLDRDEVFEARAEMTRRLAADGNLAAGTDPMDAIASAGSTIRFKPDLARGNESLMRLIYSGRMMAFFEFFFSEPARHFDYTWVRAISPGVGTASHCDAVYMNRGTSRLFTCWTPLGDIDFKQGGLMVLAKSNNNQRLRDTYCKYDVDTFCENRPHIDGWKQGGHLTEDSNQVQKSIGGQWHTTEYRAGDILIFSIFTVHCSLDNHSDRIRLSSDSRYQPASQPADERWVGEVPGAHRRDNEEGTDLLNRGMYLWRGRIAIVLF